MARWAFLKTDPGRYIEPVTRPTDFRSHLGSLPEPADTGTPGWKQAAVAALLRQDAGNEFSVLLMQRAKRSGDRWSGQICLPGGSREPQDRSLLQTAIRETHEELGFDLSRCASPLCRLPRLQARARAAFLEMEVTPYIFAHDQDPELNLGVEAEQAFWFPLSAAARGDLDTTKRIQAATDSGEFSRVLPAWNFSDQIVWGMTYFMLRDLLGALKRQR